LRMKLRYACERRGEEWEKLPGKEETPRGEGTKKKIFVGGRVVVDELVHYRRGLDGVGSKKGRTRLFFPKETGGKQLFVAENTKFC